MITSRTSTTIAGNLRCWGSGGIDRRGFAQPPDLGPTLIVSTGLMLACAVTSATQAVRCWDSGHDLPVQEQPVPSSVVGPVTILGAGQQHACAVNATGNMSCWLWSDPSRVDLGQAKVPQDLGAVKAIALGEFYTCAVTASPQTLRCWGSSDYFGAPVLVPSDLGPVRAAAAGGAGSCAVSTAGTLRCWNPSSAAYTTVPPDLGPTVMASVGGSHICAVTTAGKVRCWGDPQFNKTGVPSSLAPAKAVVAGGSHTCALTTAGDVVCWGNNVWGQQDVPLDVGFVIALATGHVNSETCVIMEPGGW